MNNSQEAFTVDYFTKYNFYEEEAFKEHHPQAEQILSSIAEYSRHQEGDHAYTKTKFGHISEGFTLRDVPVIFYLDKDYLTINGEKRHLDLKYKMECITMEDHVRIGTKIIEDGKSISCLLYINLEQAPEFIKHLENLKQIQNN